MTIFARRDASGLVAALVIAAIGLASVAEVGAVAASKTDRLAARLDRLVVLGAPGALARFRNGRQVWIGRAGVADIASGRPIAASDAWRIASVTKVVTAVLVIELARNKKLLLDAPISRYLPGIVPDGNRVTVRQLLNHTSGIAEYTADPRDPIQISAAELVRDLRLPRSWQGSLAIARRLPKAGKPGGEYAYSNTNYVILGQLIEAVTGRDYHDLVIDEFVRDLDLRSTGFPALDGRIPVQHLSGYVPADGPDGPFSDRQKLLDVTQHTYFLDADGGLYSNLDDLASMVDALWSKRYAQGAAIRSQIKEMISDHEGRYRYGLGIMERTLSCGTVVYGHEGLDLGIVTEVFTNRGNTKQLILVVNSALDNAPRLEEALEAYVDDAFCR